MGVFVIALEKLRAGGGDALAEYSGKARPIVASHGGSLVAGGLKSSKIVQDTEWDRAVIFRFPGAEAVEGWLNDPDYLAILPIRERAIEKITIATFDE